MKNVDKFQKVGVKQTIEKLMDRIQKELAVEAERKKNVLQMEIETIAAPTNEAMTKITLWM